MWSANDLALLQSISLSAAKFIERVYATMDTKIAEVNEAVQAILKHVEQMQKEPGADQRRLALAKTNIEQGFMWLESALVSHK